MCYCVDKYFLLPKRWESSNFHSKVQFLPWSISQISDSVFQVYLINCIWQECHPKKINVLDDTIKKYVVVDVNLYTNNGVIKPKG